MHKATLKMGHANSKLASKIFQKQRHTVNMSIGKLNVVSALEVQQEK